MSLATIALSCVRAVRNLTNLLVISTGLAVPLAALAVQPNGATYHGAIPGEFNVSPSGAATYSIPIEVPPGIAGMQPQLSLDYNSQAGNGLLGLGWALGGLSSITRCPATLPQDGFIDGVDFDSNDRFCLDGQRLMVVANMDCGEGTEYRTEIDSYSRICAYGAASNPSWFEVRTKAGQRIEYGNSGDSRVEAQGRIQPDAIIWMQNKVADSSGNHITYEYLEDVSRSMARIQAITFTGNVDTGRLGTSAIRFIYDENRPDVLRNYIGGSLYEVRERLNRISIEYQNQEISYYRIVYEAVGAANQSRVTTIDHCSLSTCKSSLHNTWATPSSGTYSGYAQNAPTYQSGFGVYVPHIADANGDGIHDVVWMAQGDFGLRAAVSLGIGDGSYGAMTHNGPTSQAGFGNYQSDIADANGDGISDLIWTSQGNFGLRVAVSLGNGDGTYGTMIHNSPSHDSGYSGYQPHVADTDGDGISDVIWTAQGDFGLRVVVSFGRGDGTYGGLMQSTPTTLTGFGIYLPHIADANGDGISDVLWVAQGNFGLRVAVSLGNGDGTYGAMIHNGPSSDTGYSSYQPQITDANGDGVSDVLWTAQGDFGLRIVVSLGRGNGLYAGIMQSTPTTLTGFGAYIPRIADANGDGISDVVWLAQGNFGLRVAVSLGYGEGSYGAMLHHGPSNDSGFSIYQPHIGDANGDGISDVIWAAQGDFGLRAAVSKGDYSGIGSHLLSIRDAASTRVNFNYASILDSGANVFERQTNAGSRALDINVVKYVVQNVVSSNIVGGGIVDSYQYVGLKAHRLGRGILGFSRISVTNSQTSIVTETTYNQDFAASGLGVDFPKTGAIDSVHTSLNGVTLRYSSTTYSVASPYTGVYQVHPVTTTEYSYELNGTLVSTVVTDNQLYDAYGNPERIVVTTTGGGETFTKTTVNAYDNDIANWYLGRLTRATVTSTTPTGTETRTSAFEYYPTTGLLKAEIVEPDDPQLLLRTEYGYDSYGNKTSVTVSDSGSNTYPITTRTSTTNYDYTNLTVDGTYRITSSNAKGHSETQVIDARFGVPLSLTGPNQLTTSWQYDGFGRKTREIRADGTETSWTYAWCDSGCAGVNYSVYSVTTQSTGSAPGVVYYDALNRELRTQATGLTGQAIYKDTRYNNLGQVSQVSRPYSAGQTQYWNDYTYDVLGRIDEEVAADGGVTKTTYNGLSITIRRHSGLLGSNTYDQSVTRLSNVQGELVMVTDEGNQNTYYQYDPFGNLTQVTDPANNASAMGYDKRGRKTSMNDPDMGAWLYRYDALGQLRLQQDAKGQVVTMTYDDLGRMLTRVEAEGTSTWYYDEAGTPGGVGKLWKVTGPNGYLQQTYYDSLGRPNRVRTVQSGFTYNSYTSYDAYGRVDIHTYPSGFRVQHGYNSNGYLTSIYNADATSEVFWTAQDMDTDGHITKELLGNGLTTVRTFDPQSGRLEFISTGIGLGTGVQFLNYEYDALGNLKKREDLNQSLTEEFGYDNYNRLTSATIAGVGTKSWGYDSLGNITAKDGYSDYAYGTGIASGAGPHAVTAARGNTYSYDANGNMTGGAGRSIGWDSGNKPVSITQGSTTLSFAYSPDGARYRQIKTVSGVTTTTHYVGQNYERVISGSTTTRKHYISAAGRTVAIRELTGSTTTMKYVHQDHLGSTDVITDAGGQVLERTSFDAFGTRRNVNWTDPVAALTAAFSTRGFTGHEQLDEVGLIHMNGRVYDPALGRFLSADPFVKYPEGAQGLNRYSYVDNNPLSRVDPSGYGWLSKTWKKIKKGVKKLFKNEIFRAIAGIALGYFAYAYVGLLSSSPLIGAGAGGFVGGFVASGGDLKTAFISGLTAMATYGVGEWLGHKSKFLSGKHIGKIAAHGTVNGLSSVAMGGKFKHGFASGGFTAFVAPPLGAMKLGDVGTLVASAVVGGTASKLGGGKFANGAITGSFMYLYNENGLERLMKGAASLDDALDAINKLHNMSLDELRTLYPEYQHRSDLEVKELRRLLHHDIIRSGGIPSLAKTIQGALEVSQDLAVNYALGGNPALANSIGVSNQLLRGIDALLGTAGAPIGTGAIPDPETMIRRDP